MKKIKRIKKTLLVFMMLACWLSILVVISFDAGFATRRPPRGTGLLGCQVQMGIGLLGDSIWANWQSKLAHFLLIFLNMHKKNWLKVVFLSDST